MQTEGLFRGVSYIIIICAAAGYVLCQHTLCAYSKQSKVKISPVLKSVDEDGELEQFVPGELLDGNRTEKCPSKTKFCYALWQDDVFNKNATSILVQGCWSASEFDCAKDECISSHKRPPKEGNNTKFCCCLGNMCNVNVSDGVFPYLNEEANPRFVEHVSYDTQTVIIAVSTMCSIAIIIMLAACFTYHMCSPTRKPSPDAVCLMEPPLPPSPAFNLECLKIAESVGRGRYGHVFRGTLYGQSVAVKIFSAQNRQNYVNERYIYCLPFMDHSCLPKLIGAEERTGPEDRLEYLLVLSFAPKGCLQDYLNNNTIDWPTFCKMAQSITQGLAHLHTEVKKDDKLKMCIAHRDLTSRNILIKADNSCMLCDFGFAICISGSKYYVNGEEQVAEATSLTDVSLEKVGTLRYMAPEVLEGAVNLRDCESSLKQIDVYALGLILWELATRCVDFFQGVEVPDYKAPFAAEIGPHPTMEQMQLLIAKHKARPLFPDIWKDTNPAVRALKETIDDCWDQDAEARLTSLCVEERLSELPILWDRYKAGTAIQGVSPTVNPTSQSRVSSMPTNQISSNPWYRGPAFEMPVIRSNSEALSPNNNWCLDNRYSGDLSMSENTAETSITMSPTELTPRSFQSNSSSVGNNLKNLAANNNVPVSGLRVTVPLQPYQGKNPIMERNLIMCPVEDVTVSGNSLVEKEDKFSRTTNSNNFHIDTDLFNTLQPNEVSESNALVPNDVLSHSTRACNPIPYVQNAVHVTSTIPKQPNVPGNGHSIQVPNGHCAKAKKNGDSGIIVGFKNFFKFPKNSPNSAASTSQATTTPVVVPSVIVPKLRNTNNTVPKSAAAVNSNLQRSLDTEVYVMDPDDEFSMTQTVVRPVANKQVYCQTVPCETGSQTQDSELSKKFPFQNGFVQSQTHPQLCMDESHRMKRPNTLPIARLEEAAATNDCDFNLENGIDDINTELSSGGQSKNPRFSLYDDRIMTTSNHMVYTDIESTSCQLGSPHLSVSVPLSIDSLCESEVSNFHQTCQKQRVQPRVFDNQ